VVGLLVRLKIRLLRNALRVSTQAAISFVLSTLCAGAVAIGVFAGLAALRGQSGAVDVTTVVFTTFAFGWLILPLVLFGLDSTLDPGTLALYPLRLRPLAVGLIAASATGAWPLANLLGLLGVTVGLASGFLGVPIALVAVVLQVLFCIVLARFVTTSLAGLLRSRRGKDFAGLLVLPIFALYEAFVQVVPRMTAEGKITANSFGGIDAWMRWTPPGLAAHAIRDASTGHPLTALLRLLLLAAIIAALGALWIRQLARALVTVDTTTQAAAVKSAGLPFANRGLLGTIAARAWAYQRREPRAKIFWGMTVVIAVAGSFASLRNESYPVGLFSAALFMSIFVGFFHGDLFGMTGPAFGSDAVALHGRKAMRAYFAGTDLVLAAIGVPVSAVLLFALATYARHPTDGLLALAINLTGLGAGLAFSNLFSAVLPYPVEKRPGNPTPKAIEGYSMHTIGAGCGSLVGTLLLMVPMIIAVLATGHLLAAVRIVTLLVAGAAYGLVIATIGVRISARIAANRIPELTQIALRSRL
jgi:ABC-2 type transport system permease protein